MVNTWIIQIFLNYIQFASIQLILKRTPLCIRVAPSADT